ncbi:hypothetical protein [Sphingomonas sp. R86521]
MTTRRPTCSLALVPMFVAVVGIVFATEAIKHAGAVWQRRQ